MKPPRRFSEAIDDPSGLIHPERRDALANRTHPLGKHPAYPEHQPAAGNRSSSYEEELASKQWRKILEKAQQYLGVPLSQRALPAIQQKLINALQLINQAESEHGPELAKLATDLVFELPEFKSAKKAYEQGQIGIDAQLVDDAAPEAEEGAPEFKNSESPEFSQPFNKEKTPADLEWMKKTVQRRHFTNAMIHGSAVSNNFLFELGAATLDRIHPDLRKAYGILMISTELGYWMFPQSAIIQQAQNTFVGRVNIVAATPEQEEDEPEGPANSDELEDAPPQRNKMVVRARGMCLPVLMQEIMKGLTEVASLPSLPNDPEERREVINKADLIDAEAWHMMLGPKLWDSFVEITDAENERELLMHLYAYIQRMDVDKFNTFMKEVLGKTPRGMQMLRELAQKVKADLSESRSEVKSIIGALLG